MVTPFMELPGPIPSPTSETKFPRLSTTIVVESVGVPQTLGGKTAFQTLLLVLKVNSFEELNDTQHPRLAFRRLTLRSATRTAQRAIPTRNNMSRLSRINKKGRPFSDAPQPIFFDPLA